MNDESTSIRPFTLTFRLFDIAGNEVCSMKLMSVAVCGVQSEHFKSPFAFSILFNYRGRQVNNPLFNGGEITLDRNTVHCY